jgi:hypothetical protein
MSVSRFTYSDYRALLSIIKNCGYVIRDYHNYMGVGTPCILRHDIDFDVEKALKMAKLEAAVNVKSTYFVLLNTNFYNVCASDTLKMIKEILALGHEIGLHYDEAHFDIPTTDFPRDLDSILEGIRKEIHLLEQIVERPVTTVSMHRPSKFILDADIAIPGVVNSYGSAFLESFKYLSDSRHCWREDVEEAILSGRHEKLHVLTHPFWYTETNETCREKLHRFITEANRRCYRNMSANFKNVEEFIKQEEI